MVASRFPRLDDPQADKADTALSLTARLAPWTVWPGLPTTLMTFGGVYPSPTYRVQRGDTFDLTLTNQLSEDTNIHWHGLNVPASMDGHPLDVVGTGGSRQYLFDVVDRAGTYWYHPHPDMRTGPQVWGGMAGVFIIDDPAEQSLGLPSGPFDVTIMLQDRRTADGSFSYTPGPSDLMDGYLGDTVLANGVPDAQITVAAATYRLRLLNLSNGRIFRVAFEDGRAFQVIAGDGGLLEHPLPATEVFLAPAERVEIVVDFSPRESRSVRLVSRPFTSGGMLAAGGVPQGTFLPLLRFKISGSGPVTTVPADLVPLPPLGPAEITRRFTMDMILPPAHGNFRINGRPYDINRVDTLIDRGVVEHWEIWNTSAHPHPFHVHAAQFRVLARSSGPLRVHERGLKDTVLVWPGEAVKIAILFDRYPGLFLLHCHNLEHEDAGMMSNFEVR
jgi:FtsP/CotA-like multicopper oxidase with cupredoxin domain